MKISSLLRPLYRNGLRIDKKSNTIVYRTHVIIKDSFIPVSMQVSLFNYRNCVEHTYNYSGLVTVIVLDRKNIVIVPNTRYVRNILRAAGFKLDKAIFVPLITISNLDDNKQRQKWAYCLVHFS